MLASKANNELLWQEAFDENRRVREENRGNRNEDINEWGNTVARIPYTYGYIDNVVYNADGTASHIERTITWIDYSAWYILQEQHPEMFCGDKHIERKAWEKFLMSEAGKPFDIDGTFGKKGDRHHIVVK